LPRSGALPAAQGSLIALPNELLGGILKRAWADRPPCDAREEIRAAAGLTSVCRRVRALLHAPPLPLALDFSGARLSAAQRRWLRHPTQVGRVEAACFHPQDSLWWQPLFGKFLAVHGRTLLRLSGVPLQLVACLSLEQRPALDLRGLSLTALGNECYGYETCLDDSSTAWLWPECLPGTLEELELLGMEYDSLEFLAWEHFPCDGLAGWLPRLHTLRVTRARGVGTLRIY